MDKTDTPAGPDGRNLTAPSTSPTDTAVERPLFDRSFLNYWLITTLFALARACDGTAAALAARDARRQVGAPTSDEAEGRP